METERESTECVALCWSLFNSAIANYTGGKKCVFNPVGWVMDEGLGLWAGLKEVYGDEATKSSVSCAPRNQGCFRKFANSRVLEAIKCFLGWKLIKLSDKIIIYRVLETSAAQFY